MAKGNIVRWITIKGRRIPIYEDGSMGGFMEGKSHEPKKDSANKTDEDFMEKENQRWEKEHGEWKDHAQGKNYQELVDRLKEGGLELDSADAHDMRNSKSFNDEKVTLYDKDGNEYEGTYNKYSDGGREVVDIKPKRNDDKIKSNIGVSHESNSHDNEVLRIRDELDSSKSTTTSNKEIADMYKNSPKKAFDVKDNGDGTYEISKKGQGSKKEYEKYDAEELMDRSREAREKYERTIERRRNVEKMLKEASDDETRQMAQNSLDRIKRIENERKHKAMEAARAADEAKSKSIKVGDKEIGIHETRMQRTKMAIANGQNNLKGMPIGDLKELAIDAGVASSKLKGMSADELRKMLLSIYKK